MILDNVGTAREDREYCEYLRGCCTTMVKLVLHTRPEMIEEHKVMTQKSESALTNLQLAESSLRELRHTLVAASQDWKKIGIIYKLEILVERLKNAST